MSEDEPAFQIIQAQLKELEHTVDVVELYPAVVPGYNPDLEDDEIKEMATFIENIRFAIFRHFYNTQRKTTRMVYAIAEAYDVGFWSGLCSHGNIYLAATSIDHNCLCFYLVVVVNKILVRKLLSVYASFIHHHHCLTMDLNLAHFALSVAE